MLHAAQQIWGGKLEKPTPVETMYRVNVSVGLKPSTAKMAVLNVVQELSSKYEPGLMQWQLAEGVRASLEMQKEIPDDTRRQLEREWKQEIGL